MTVFKYTCNRTLAQKLFAAHHCYFEKERKGSVFIHFRLYKTFYATYKIAGKKVDVYLFGVRFF